MLHAFVETVHPHTLMALALWFCHLLVRWHKWRHVRVEETRKLMWLAMLRVVTICWRHHWELEWKESEWIWWKTIGLACLILAAIF